VPVAAILSSFHRDFLIVFPLGSRVALFQNSGELSMGKYNSGDFDPGAIEYPRLTAQPKLTSDHPIVPAVGGDQPSRSVPRGSTRW
jgi:hypothetical protein